MSTGSGITGCTATFEPQQLPQYLSNQCWYVAFFYIFVQHTF